ncbi:hypothetical protein NDU88_003884 [Pleurodeles waltl]|uniref:Uncharacterized protein n=1 Tax=Pleurodeles waltl TaxID=8319 RepID=A0AAV7TQV7_PLEWA|nr:hypothetical protein NDU88_003884 [Pleurodeles waltl]
MKTETSLEATVRHNPTAQADLNKALATHTRLAEQLRCVDLGRTRPRFMLTTTRPAALQLLIDDEVVLVMQASEC